jgi:hypothetical protein
MALSKGMVIDLVCPEKTNDCLPVALAVPAGSEESEGAEDRAGRDRCSVSIPRLPQGRLILPDTICSVFEQNTDGQRLGG